MVFNSLQIRTCSAQETVLTITDPWGIRALPDLSWKEIVTISTIFRSNAKDKIMDKKTRMSCLMIPRSVRNPNLDIDALEKTMKWSSTINNNVPDFLVSKKNAMASLKNLANTIVISSIIARHAMNIFVLIAYQILTSQNLHIPFLQNLIEECLRSWVENKLEKIRKRLRVLIDEIN